ncbi:MAG TPA: hypothetical protein VK778_12230 [Solirubrobacteraceae bacterium]|jgi:hypothetical protein|nr:hypothetical protein [Solirubrobacteraceae bacterium]
MTVGEFILGMLRLAAMVLPAWLTAHRLRAGWLRATGALAALAETVLTLSVLLVAAELLGVLALDHAPELIALLCVCAALSRLLVGGASAAKARAPARRAPEPAACAGMASAAAAVGVVVVAAQWGLQSANALGAGMLNFDTLWYHMPFAASFAQTGSVTGIEFTQADPYVAYYPANSELFHAIGIVALHNDFASPLLNLLWLAVAMLAAWCVGSRWRVERLTLLAGCLVLSLPVLGGTQPGEAYNDIVGLAALMAASALVVSAPEDTATLAVAGLALGVAVGTKLTFLVPAFGLLAGMGLIAARGRRRRVLGALAAPLALTGGWWYLRNAIAVGNPLGLAMHVGPLALPGPRSPLASASQQTVASEISHLSLWGSRFAPGLDHALGPLWPLVLGLCVAAVVTGALSGDRPVRVLAVVAGAAGVTYLFLPTGATGLEQGSILFQINLRYATPALALGIVLVPVVVRLRAPRALAALGPGLALVLLASQLERELWPTQTARHVAFLAACAVVAAVGWRARSLRWRSRATPATTAALACGALLVLVVAAFAAQRHYFARRYLVGFQTSPALGEVYRWAQGVAHARIGLYGTVEQYPLYGARDTNVVDYLGERTSDGGYRPISSCRAWRESLSAGGYAYVVLTPAPTSPIPLRWTAGDPAATLVLNPAPSFYVFRMSTRASSAGCS